MEDSPVFAKEEAIERVGDDVEYFQEMFAMTYPQFPDSLQKLRTAAAEEQASEVREIAHGIKSQLGTLGGMRAYCAAEKIEVQGKSGKLEGIAQSIDALENEIDCFVKAVKEAFPSLS